MTFATLLRDVVGRLNQAGITYMVTGSVAGSYYGEPRATNDIDVLVDPDVVGLESLVDGLIADGYYVDREAAREALAQRTQFNAIAPGALKVDFVIRKDRPFSRQELERRRPVDLLGIAGYVPALEDLIVAKLEWAAFGESERQLRDVASLLAVAGDDIDLPHVARWVGALHLEEVWDRIAPG